MQVEHRQQQLDQLYTRYATPKKKNGGAQQDHGSLAEDDRNIIDRLLRNDKFSLLWKGDHSAYNSQSEADLSLCSILAGITQDEKKLDRIFRASGLYRDKWDRMHGATTYGSMTIGKSLQGGEDTGKNYRLTELGNAERFADEHGDSVRYVPSLKKWLAYDSRRWQIGADERIRQLAQRTAKNIYSLAAQERDNDAAARLAKWAAQSCKSSSITAMLKEAAAMLTIDLSELDSDPMLFNCANCTINFHTGGIQPHRKSDFITKITEVPFDPEATAPLFEKVVNTAFKGNANLVQFIQKFFGYSMTGSTKEQCIAIWQGPGANGKSTIQNPVAEVLGEYVQTTRPETLMARKDGGIPSDIAKLKGARLVLASESEDGHRLAESAIKQMTGGEKIQARALYSDWFEFIPQFKIILCTNHKPVIRGDDLAIWRRIRLVPFNNVIPEDERDLDLAEKLRKELPGILKWIVTGAAAWLTEGLGPPAEIIAATADYKTEQNVLSLFFEHCCILKTDAMSESSQLFLAFDKWRTREGQRKITQRKFGLMLTDAGFEKIKTGGRYSYCGIGLNDHFQGPQGPQGPEGEKQ